MSNKSEEPIINLTDEEITAHTVTYGSIVSVFFQTDACRFFVTTVCLRNTVKSRFGTISGFCNKKIKNRRIQLVVNSKSKNFN